jgi:hypothetical protein
MPKNRVLITKGAACQHRTPTFRPTNCLDRYAPALPTPGLLAASRGLSRMFTIEQFNAGPLLYDRVAGTGSRDARRPV